MPNRASLFSPFAALEGLEEDLKKEEIMKEEKPILSIDEIEEMNQVLISLQINEKIKVIYFEEKMKKIIGYIKKVNPSIDEIQIDNTKIKISSLIKIEKEK